MPKSKRNRVCEFILHFCVGTSKSPDIVCPRGSRHSVSDEEKRERGKERTSARGSGGTLTMLIQVILCLYCLAFVVGGIWLL